MSQDSSEQEPAQGDTPERFGLWADDYQPVRRRTEASLALVDTIERLCALELDEAERVLKSAAAFFGFNLIKWPKD